MTDSDIKKVDAGHYVHINKPGEVMDAICEVVRKGESKWFNNYNNLFGATMIPQLSKEEKTQLENEAKRNYDKKFNRIET